MIKRASSDGGAALIMVAMSMMLLLGGAALAIDIGGLWLDRSADQKVSDSAAAAGVLGVVVTDGQAGCEAALAYAAINADELTTLDDSGCAAALGGSCDPAVAKTHTVSSGRYTITVTYPVPDTHALMTSGIIGATAQALDPGDGESCDRLGVEISATRNSVFAQLLGFDQGTTTVHTVATAKLDTEDGTPLNLLVLDRFGCQTIDVQGNGGIIVDAVIKLDESGNPIGLVPGVAASDSDGSAGCVADGVIDINGSWASLRADGPQGCPDETATHLVGAYTAGEGCGQILTLAPGTPGCAPSPANTPACTPGAGGGNRPQPEPTALPARLTRAPVDYRFNCWPDYTSPPGGVGWAVAALTVGNEQDIPGCTAGDPDHIYDLINAVGQFGKPAGFTAWNADLGHPCTVDSSNPGIVVTNGKVWIDCPVFTIKSLVRINGFVVFDGDVNITSGTAHLDLNNSLGSPGWAFFRNGALTKDAQADLTFNYTAVYMSKTSQLVMSGGSGSLTWIAPDSGDFDDLALWSDGSLPHFWAGQASLVMEGLFFSPLATADYSGTSGQNQPTAQWVADKLTARGQGRLTIRPFASRGVFFPGVPPTELIR